MQYHPRVIGITQISEAKEEIRRIGVDASSIPIMAPKAVFRAVKLLRINPKAALILKQEMLSKGGEAAVSRDVWEGKPTDVLILGTIRQFEMLIIKLTQQPYGLKGIADEIKQVLKSWESVSGHCLRLGPYSLPLGERTYIMGILNITPDSFSDGGRYTDPQAAVEHALRMVDEGADIIDVGAESTRPGAVSITQEEEASRLEPVLKALTKHINVPISVDTYRAKTAEMAINTGALIINDVWGLKHDSDMAKVIAKTNAAVVIMHNRQDTDYSDLMGEIVTELGESINMAVQAGVDLSNLIIDPGIGFGKTTEQNLEVLAKLSELKALGLPVLLGTSRKSVIGKTLKLPTEERIEGTAATAALGIANGADIIRVHDVKQMARVARMSDAIVRK
jgi:dihydropteroate synthase